MTTKPTLDSYTYEQLDNATSDASFDDMVLQLVAFKEATNALLDGSIMGDLESEELQLLYEKEYAELRLNRLEAIRTRPLPMDKKD